MKKIFKSGGLKRLQNGKINLPISAMEAIKIINTIYKYNYQKIRIK